MKWIKQASGGYLARTIDTKYQSYAIGNTEEEASLKVKKYAKENYDYDLDREQVTVYQLDKDGCAGE